MPKRTRSRSRWRASKLRRIVEAQRRLGIVPDFGDAKDVKEGKKETEESKETKRSFVYILEREGGRQTYVGFTVNPARRLRQHNGELVGGAKYTTRGDGKWRFAAIITADGNWWTRIAAQQLEYAEKHCRSLRWRRQGIASTAAASLAISRAFRFEGHPGISRRLLDLYKLLNSRTRWTSTAPEYTPENGRSLSIYIAEPFFTEALRARLGATANWNPVIRPLDAVPGETFL